MSFNCTNLNEATSCISLPGVISPLGLISKVFADSGRFVKIALLSIIFTSTGDSNVSSAISKPGKSGAAGPTASSHLSLGINST